MGWNKQKTHKHVPTQTRQQILNRDQHTCQNCGHYDPTGKTLHIDHIKNLKQGGTNHPNNLQTLCHWCHNHKTQQEATQARNNWKRQPQKHPGLK